MLDYSFVTINSKDMPDATEIRKTTTEVTEEPGKTKTVETTEIKEKPKERVVETETTTTTTVETH